MWGNLSDNAREQFFWAHPPRGAFDAEPEDVPKGGRAEDTGNVLPVPDVHQQEEKAEERSAA